MLQQYSFDEETVPPKVVCWNDLSALDSKSAEKTVRAGIKHEYKVFSDKLSFTFDSVSHGNKDMLPIPENTSDMQLIYHVIDPTITQKSRAATNASVQSSRLILSRSGSQFYSLTDPSLISTPIAPSSPIQEDPPSLRFLSGQVPDNTVFIFDCSFADDALKVLTEKSKDIIVLAASQDTLNYYPQLPCDLFTSCLLTPSKVAVLWEIQNNTNIRSGFLSDIDIQILIDIFNEYHVFSEILDMLDKALEAYVDTMASEVMESNPYLFQKVFRKNTFLSRLFTNFIFSHRMMKTISAIPTSFPPLPDMSTHELWDSFFFQVDRALYSLKESMKPTPRNIFAYNDLLEEQMKHLENWLLFPKKDRPSPMELPFVEILISSPEFFKRSIHFCAKFVEISEERTKSLMETRTFPILHLILKDKSTIEESGDETIADFTFVIISCVLLKSSLLNYFTDYIDFWLMLMKSETEKLAIYSLSMLLLFSCIEKGIQKLNDEKFIQEMMLFTKSDKSPYLRTLSHIILGHLGHGIKEPLEEMQDENDPMARAAIVSRVITTIDKETSDTARDEMIFNLIALLNDPYNRVREESLIALSHSLATQPPNFFSTLKDYVATFNDDSVESSIVKLLAHTINILMYEPSTRVSQRIEEFLCYIDAQIVNVQTKPLESNFTNGLLNRIAHPPITKTNVSLSYSANQMIADECILTGSPSISPSGLLSCADTAGRMHAQVTSYGIPARQVYNFFKTSLVPEHIPYDFKTMYNNRLQARSMIEYQTFIDDMRVLTVSNRSQLCVINTLNNFDAESSFWMNEPDNPSMVYVDYMHKNAHLLFSSGGNSSKIRIYDIGSLKSITDIRIKRKPLSKMQWLKPYSTLFYVAQDNVYIYDSRMQKQVAAVEGSDMNFLSANACTAMPLYMLQSSKNGKIRMIDMRTMKTVAEEGIGGTVKMFDVHTQLPYAVALTNNSFVGISFENGTISTVKQDLDTTPDGFCLHSRENLCAIRSVNTIYSRALLY
ncbi:hypothetical protein TVAG_113500 [Trichomonas vaginalis G3]|uniref:Raptor N-terminal CASPase-like domain-containing protein n=1 Tax=Trichomonas vaginalis (strain ATCC PRA-98 / G3) TaxID=412133 RepID=A2DNK3_TRIV3|nr:TOR signaling [Trichomonas vaginalis G3]EAY18006.1 hypothetical protein TVAG_113500 [Trichomonas vaginalis G3]KAI5524435.1 TOR signaling [Trichomonas vaginalis G3]|eukprot:XP_001578992.1 hypothetical protein [Trichomonas vaginalis G3]